MAKFLAKGTYGCVYNPSFKCIEKEKSRNKDLNIVGKIFKNEEDAIEEWNESMRVRSIDPHGKYFLYPEDICDVTVETILMGTRDVSQCPYISTKFGSKQKQLLAKHGGITLLDHFKSLDNVSLRRSEMLKMLMNLFKGIRLLDSHDCAHQDIKVANIVVSTDNKVKIIDFGLLMSASDGFYNSKTNFLFFNKDIKYIINPPEYRFHHYKDLDKVMVDKEYEELKYYKTKFTKQDLIKQLKNFMKKISKYDTVNKVQAYLQKKKIHKKSDVYSLGIILSRLCISCIPENQDITSPLMNELIQGMTHANPFERFDINESINLAKAIIAMDKKPSPKTTPSIKKENVIQFKNTPSPKEKECPKGQVRSPKTGECKTIVSSIPKNKPKKDCPPGQVRNPATGRCKKIVTKVVKTPTPVKKSNKKDCPPGQFRNPATGRCKKIVEKKECPPGQERNPATGRCRKIRSG